MRVLVQTISKRCGRSRARRLAGFTLIELLVVVSIIAVLIAVLLPALSKARHAALAVKDLANMRSIELAHYSYMVDHDGGFMDVGLDHAGHVGDHDVAWINSLKPYYRTPLVARSPLDTSPHWGPYPRGEPIPGAPATDRRVTSYGCNNYLTSAAPYTPYLKLDRVPRPSATVHLLIMAYKGGYAGADHVHVETWGVPGFPTLSPLLASEQCQTDAVAGPTASNRSRSNWAFLDGHAECLPFADVFTDFSDNRFDPAVAR